MEFYCTSVENPRICVYLLYIDMKTNSIFLQHGCGGNLVKYRVSSDSRMVMTCSSYCLFDSYELSACREMVKVILVARKAVVSYSEM
jgi:uncharacterized Rmd1/YagE family protein